MCGCISLFVFGLLLICGIFYWPLWILASALMIVAAINQKK
jgi:hypothetical protein